MLWFILSRLERRRNRSGKVSREERPASGFSPSSSGAGGAWVWMEDSFLTLHRFFSWLQQRRKSRDQSGIREVRPSIEQLGERIVPATIAFSGAVSTDPTNGMNWVGGQVPGATDTAEFGPNAQNNCVISANTVYGGVQIDAGFGKALQVNNGATLTTGNMVMAGGTVSGPGTVSVTSALTWSGGTMQDAGTTTLGPGAVMTINGQGPKTLNGRQLQTLGNVNMGDTGPLVMSNGSQITIGANTTFAINSDAWIQDGGGSASKITNNEGTFDKTAGFAGNQTQVQVQFVDAPGGIVNVDAGLLNFTNSFDFNGDSISGAGSVSFQGSFTWEQGSIVDLSMAQTGQTTFSGPVTIQGTVDKAISNRPISALNSVTWIGADPSSPSTLEVQGTRAVLSFASRFDVEGNVSMAPPMGGGTPGSVIIGQNGLLVEEDYRGHPIISSNSTNLSCAA